MDVEKLSSTALNEVSSAQQLQHCAWLAECVPWQTVTTRAAVTTQRTSAMASEQKEIRVLHVLTIASQKETQAIPKSWMFFFSVTFEMKLQMFG